MQDFLTTVQTQPPTIPVIYFMLMLLGLGLLSYLSWRCYDSKVWRWTFIGLQIIQLVALYGWYLWKDLPLSATLPLYHCRLAMFALLLLRDGRLKNYFAIMGVVGSYCAFIYPVFDPYDFPHITGFSFLLGHYALLVNGLNTLFRTYSPYPVSARMLTVGTLLLNLFLVAVNHLTGGNYGLLKHPPFISDFPLIIKYITVSVLLIGLMLVFKIGLDRTLTKQERS